MNILLAEPFDQETIIRGMVKEERREAWMEGKEEGKEEGIALGERRKSIAIARNLLKGGYMPYDVVASITNLTLPEVEALARGEEIERL